MTGKELFTTLPLGIENSGRPVAYSRKGAMEDITKGNIIKGNRADVLEFVKAMHGKCPMDDYPTRFEPGQRGLEQDRYLLEIF